MNTKLLERSPSNSRLSIVALENESLAYTQDGRDLKAKVSRASLGGQRLFASMPPSAYHSTSLVDEATIFSEVGFVRESFVFIVAVQYVLANSARERIGSCKIKPIFLRAPRFRRYEYPDRSKRQCL